MNQSLVLLLLVFLQSLLFLGSLGMLLLDKRPEILKLSLNFLEQLSLVLILLVLEGRHNVVELFGVSDGVVLQIPVIHYEGQVVSDLYLLCNLIPDGESITHDGNQHVKQMDQQNKLGCDEQRVQVNFLCCVPVSEHVRAPTTQANIPHVEQGAWHRLVWNFRDLKFI